MALEISRIFFLVVEVVGQLASNVGIVVRGVPGPIQRELCFH